MSATGPNVAQITLPPGFTLEQYYDHQGKVVDVAIGMAVAVALVIWDFLSMFPAERELFRQNDKNLWKTPSAFAFMILRYAGVFALVPGLFFTSVQNQHCQVAASLGEVGVILVTASAGIIFCSRVFAIWGYDKFVVAVVGTLYFFMVSCWIAVATQLRAHEGPPTAFGSNCILHPVPTWDPICLASSVAFDTTVLFLTLIKLRRDTMKSSTVGNQILKDNILYFVIVTVTNIVVLIIQSLPGEKYAFVKPVALPYPTLMTTAMGTRIYLNLRLYNLYKQRRQTTSETLPWNPVPLDTMKGVMVSSQVHTHTAFTHGGQDISKQFSRTPTPEP